MADSDESAWGPARVGRMNIRDKFTVAVCIALMAILPMTEGVADGAGAEDAPAKPTFMHLPMQLRNPRGVGLSRTSNPAHLLELHNQWNARESDPVPEDHGNTFQDENDGVPRFAHHPVQHIHNPRGSARASGPMEGVDVDPISADHQAECATTKANEVRFSHLPRLHNPRAVNVVKQIQGRMSKESRRQAKGEGENF